MLKARWLRDLQQYLLCILAFAIPLPFIFGSVAIILVIAGWLLQLKPKETFINLRERNGLWPWFIYYALHAISYYYSENKEQSLFDLQTKLSFIILPLVIGTSSYVTSKVVERILFSFTCGVTLVSVLSLGRAGIMLLQHQPYDTIFYNHLVEGLDANAVTHAWYSIFSISILVFMRWDTLFTGRWKYLKFLLILLQLTFFILLSARTMTGLFFAFVMPYYFIRIAGKAVKWRLAFVTLSAVIFTLIVFTKNPIKERYKSIFEINVNQAFLPDYTGIYESEFSNLTTRLFFWRLGFENMKEHNLWLWGAGNGDVFKLQNDRMHHYGMNIYPPVEWWHSPFFNANLHNMYLQSWIMIGLPGLLMLIIITCMPFSTFNSIRNKPVFLIFCVVSICVMLQESALQSQAGIVYYSFFISVLWAYYYNDGRLKYDQTIID